MIGTMLVWSSTRTWAAGSTGLVKKHILNLVIGAVLAGAAAMVTTARCGPTRRWCTP